MLHNIEFLLAVLKTISVSIAKINVDRAAHRIAGATTKQRQSQASFIGERSNAWEGGVAVQNMH
jgi:hypothetical protein